MTFNNYKIVSGIGEACYELLAFDKALVNAGIGDYNLVRVSSILPSGCIESKDISVEKGGILYTAYASAIVKAGESKSLAVAIALPVDNLLNGVIFETEADLGNAEKYVKDMCATAMLTRNRTVKDYQSTSVDIYGKESVYVCGLVAVVMW